MKKRYILLFVVFLLVDILWVVYPNIKSIHTFRVSRKEMENEITKYELREKKSIDKDKEEYLFQLDEIMNEEGIQIEERSFNITQNGDFLLSLILHSSKNQLLNLLSSSKWNKSGYQIVMIDSEFEENDILRTTLEILITD